MPSNFASADPIQAHRDMTKRDLWKLDCHILPALALLWLANFIDRSNIGNARIAGLEKDTKLHGNQFNIILAVFYITYLLIELPSNIVLKKMKANSFVSVGSPCWWGCGELSPFKPVWSTTSVVWLPSVLSWVCVKAVCSQESYLSIPFSVASALILCVADSLFKHGIQASRATIKSRDILRVCIALWCFRRTSRDHHHKNGRSWWLGRLTLDLYIRGSRHIIASGLAAWVLPEGLAAAPFFTEEERAFAIRRFQTDDAAILTSSPETPSPTKSLEDMKKEIYEHVESKGEAGSQQVTEEVFEWNEVVRGIFDIQVWLTAIAYFGLVVGLYSYSLFLPTIVAGLGYTGSSAQLHIVPPYVPAAVLTVVVAFLSDRFRWRGPFILICLPLAFIGYILAITAETNGTRYIAIFFMAAGVYLSAPCILSILPNNISGHYKRATATALQLAIANAGGFVATFAYTPDQKPKYIRGHTISLTFVILAWILVWCNVLYCKWENKARSEGRRQGNLTAYQALVDGGKTKAPTGDRHPDFRFTL